MCVFVCRAKMELRQLTVLNSCRNILTNLRKEYGVEVGKTGKSGVAVLMDFDFKLKPSKVLPGCGRGFEIYLMLAGGERAYRQFWRSAKVGEQPDPATWGHWEMKCADKFFGFIMGTGSGSRSTMQQESFNLTMVARNRGMSRSVQGFMSKITPVMATTTYDKLLKVLNQEVEADARFRLSARQPVCKFANFCFLGNWPPVTLFFGGTTTHLFCGSPTA